MQNEKWKMEEGEALQNFLDDAAAAEGDRAAELVVEHGVGGVAELVEDCGAEVGGLDDAADGVGGVRI